MASESQLSIIIMAENFSWRDPSEFFGIVSEVNSNAKFVVLLDDGYTVTASK